jgi:hypothetical protein
MTFQLKFYKTKQTYDYQPINVLCFRLMVLCKRMLH